MAPPRKKDGCIDWKGMYEKGENPNGMMAQTADATVRNADGLGRQEWKFNQTADGPEWNDGFSPKPDFLAVPPPRGRRRR